jgi:peptidyl-prolyl cis-trans isomerase B (cyclophilin B)
MQKNTIHLRLILTYSKVLFDLRALQIKIRGSFLINYWTLHMITFRTTMGDISIELDFDNAPISSANFLTYAKDEFYNDTVFHRVINGFMVQGGGMTSDMQQKKTNAPIENEADNGLKNDIGTLAMARTADPHSASSQFFINVSNNDFLNHSGKNMQGWGYAVFGKVVEGMDVIEKIKTVPTGSVFGHQDVPVDPIEITETIISDDYAAL